MEESPTTAALLKEELVSDAEIDAAVDAFLADPKVTQFALNEQFNLNLSGAVKAHAFARDNLRNPEASPGLKRAAVRKAILLARPEKR